MKARLGLKVNLTLNKALLRLSQAYFLNLDMTEKTNANLKCCKRYITYLMAQKGLKVKDGRLGLILENLSSAQAQNFEARSISIK